VALHQGNVVPVPRHVVAQQRRARLVPAQRQLTQDVFIVTESAYEYECIVSREIDREYDAV
jgi:predicted GNAT superfamily acetyltransferase